MTQAYTDLLIAGLMPNSAPAATLSPDRTQQED